MSFADRTWRAFDGLELHARDYAAGSGPARLPVICLHGLTRNARDFEDLAPRLAARGRRVLAVDVRGRGASAWDPDPLNYQPATYAQDVIALAVAAGLARAQFVGTSMGGIIAMVLASVRPDLVAGAVLNDVGPEIAPEGVRRIGGYVGVPSGAADWSEAADFARRLNAFAFPAYGPAEWDRFARRIFREDPSGRPVLDYDPRIAEPVRQAGAAGLAPPLWPLWAALAAGRPVLAVRGAISDLLSPQTYARMLASAPTVAGVEIPGVGHAPALDEPEALAAIDGFFDANP